MFLTEEQLKVQALLVETVTLLCKNGLRFKSDVRIEGLIGITIDSEQVVLVNINEAIMLPSSSENRFRASASGIKSSDFSVGQEGQKLAKTRKRKTRVKRNGGNCKDQVVVADDTVADEVAEDSDNAYDSVDTSNSVKMKRCDMQAEQHLSMTVEDELLGELVSCGTVKLEPGSLGKTCDSIDADDIYEDDSSAGCSKWPSDGTGDSGGGTSTIVMSRRTKSTKCPQCDKQYSTPGGLQRHALLQHHLVRILPVDSRKKAKRRGSLVKDIVRWRSATPDELRREMDKMRRWQVHQLNEDGGDGSCE